MPTQSTMGTNDILINTLQHVGDDLVQTADFQKQLIR